MACRLATVVAAALAALVLFVGGVTCAAEVAGERTSDGPIKIDPAEFYTYMERVLSREMQVMAVSQENAQRPGARPAAFVEAQARLAAGEDPMKCRLMMNTWLGRCVFAHDNA